MTDAHSRTAEIDAYLVAVERHLADLPEAIRQDLMSDLDTHLAEVAADLDAGVALRDLLGSPEAYARELRETAEVSRERAGDRLRRGLREAAEPLTRRLKAGADKYAVSTGHADAAEMRERLRPGWWVLRGALVAVLFLYLLAISQFNASGYNLFGSLLGTLLAVVAVLLGVWASMRIGAKSREWGKRKRWWTGAVGIGVVVTAYGLLWPISGFVPMSAVETASHDVGVDDYYITDIQVYDENGDPVTGVYLFDQNGEPLMIGDPWACDWEEEDPFGNEDATTGAGAEGDGFPENNGPDDDPDPDLGYLYPICGPAADEPSEPAPSERPSETATASEDPTADPTATEDPTSTAEPTATTEPSPSETG